MLGGRSRSCQCGQCLVALGPLSLTGKDLIETFEMRQSNASDETARLVAAELHKYQRYFA